MKSKKSQAKIEKMIIADLDRLYRKMLVEKGGQIAAKKVAAKKQI
jgi:hypothetical protein